MVRHALVVPVLSVVIFDISGSGSTRVSQGHLLASRVPMAKVKVKRPCSEPWHVEERGRFRF